MIPVYIKRGKVCARASERASETEIEKGGKEELQELCKCVFV